MRRHVTKFGWVRPTLKIRPIIYDKAVQFFSKSAITLFF